MGDIQGQGIIRVTGRKVIIEVYVLADIVIKGIALRQCSDGASCLIIASPHFFPPSYYGGHGIRCDALATKGGEKCGLIISACIYDVHF